MSVLSPDQIVDLTLVLVLIMGVGITWAVYYGSDLAELPGDAPIPDPAEVDDATPETSGRTLA